MRCETREQLLKKSTDSEKDNWVRKTSARTIIPVRYHGQIVKCACDDELQDASSRARLMINERVLQERSARYETRVQEVSARYTAIKGQS